MIQEQLRDLIDDADMDREKTEAISSAALEYNGQLFTARSHAEASLLLDEAFPDADMAKVQDGFITNTGRFINRTEALEVAKSVEQVSKERLRRGEDTLDSEDLNWTQRI